MAETAGRFAGKLAMVTAAANGIGRACALRFAAEGAALAVLDLEEATLTEAFATVPAERLLVQAGDGTEREVLEAFHRAAVARFGPVDILFNNLGQSAREKGGPFHEAEEETWRFVLEISLFATLRLSRLVAPAMRERGGRIVNMSSDAAFVGDAGLSDYAAAKMGVVGFTRSLARELAPHGVTVNAVAPGAIRTRAHDRVPAAVIETIRSQTPAGFVGEPEDVAAAVCFLASEEARFITGQTLLIDGGRWMI